MDQEQDYGLKTGYTNGNTYGKSRSTKTKKSGERIPKSPEETCSDSRQDRSSREKEENGCNSEDDKSFQDDRTSNSGQSQSDQKLSNGHDNTEDETDSSSETDEVQQTATFAGQESVEQEISSRQAKIIRDILANFDLEKVMDRYRGESVFRSCNRSKFRLWLEDIMGNEKAPFNDRKWNDAFRQKVLEDLERKQDERERRLAEAETQRVLKLKIQGVIRDDREGTGRKERQRQSAAERRFERRKAKKHESLFKPNDIETQMEILNRDESEVKRRDRQHGRRADKESDGQSKGSDSGEGSDDVPTYRSHLGRIKVEKTVDVHPDVQKLYTEEDLEQLYREAESLVRRTTTRPNKK
ncbi:unnamed protein product [Lymnaea stagnalis]|uniref:Uncharacterized protein n=1 Tax=Lymnaea stagnalis TaxID=6523 RepID=A0AAV2ILE4_LYMST